MFWFCFKIQRFRRHECDGFSRMIGFSKSTNSSIWYHWWRAISAFRGSNNYRFLHTFNTSSGSFQMEEGRSSTHSFTLDQRCIISFKTWENKEYIRRFPDKKILCMETLSLYLNHPTTKVLLLFGILFSLLVI